MEYAIKAFESAAKDYLDDLEVMSEEQLLGSAGGEARKPVDFTYEVAVIQNRVAAILSVKDPGPSPFGEGWIEAPAELASKVAIMEFMQASCDDLLEVARGLTDEQSAIPVGTKPENAKPAYAHLNFLALHAMYHDAQLNFIQSLNGDMAVHWS